MPAHKVIYEKESNITRYGIKSINIANPFTNRGKRSQ